MNFSYLRALFVLIVITLFTCSSCKQSRVDTTSPESAKNQGDYLRSLVAASDANLALTQAELAADHNQLLAELAADHNQLLATQGQLLVTQADENALQAFLLSQIALRDQNHLVDENSILMVVNLLRKNKCLSYPMTKWENSSCLLMPIQINYNSQTVGANVSQGGFWLGSRTQHGEKDGETVLNQNTLSCVEPTLVSEGLVDPVGTAANPLPLPSQSLVAGGYWSTDAGDPRIISSKYTPIGSIVKSYTGTVAAPISSANKCGTVIGDTNTVDTLNYSISANQLTISRSDPSVSPPISCSITYNTCTTTTGCSCIGNTTCTATEATVTGTGCPTSISAPSVAASYYSQYFNQTGACAGNYTYPGPGVGTINITLSTGSDPNKDNHLTYSQVVNSNSNISYTSTTAYSKPVETSPTAPNLTKALFCGRSTVPLVQNTTVNISTQNFQNSPGGPIPIRWDNSAGPAYIQCPNLQNSNPNVANQVVLGDKVSDSINSVMTGFCASGVVRQAVTKTGDPTTATTLISGFYTPNPTVPAPDLTGSAVCGGGGQASHESIQCSALQPYLMIDNSDCYFVGNGIFKDFTSVQSQGSYYISPKYDNMIIDKAGNHVPKNSPVTVRGLRFIQNPSASNLITTLPKIALNNGKPSTTPVDFGNLVGGPENLFPQAPFVMVGMCHAGPTSSTQNPGCISIANMISGLNALAGNTYLQSVDGTASSKPLSIARFAYLGSEIDLVQSLQNASTLPTASGPRFSNGSGITWGFFSPTTVGLITQTANTTLPSGAERYLYKSLDLNAVASNDVILNMARFCKVKYQPVTSSIWTTAPVQGSGQVDYSPLFSTDPTVLGIPAGVVTSVTPVLTASSFPSN